MRHLLLCREYPPVSGGGIGSYTARIAKLLAERGDVVHVVSQRWRGADQPLERLADGRLVIHRVPCERAGRALGLRPHRELSDPSARALFGSVYPPQAFAWSAGLLAERLVEQAQIDVIEAPEYEASLYFFQLRRALGLGPDRKPPCVIHLHSPTEIIARYNDWDLGHPYFLTAKRLEDFSMSAADALLCPSRYLADEIAGRPDLRCETVRVIHYPAPGWESPRDRSRSRTSGPIVYVGRLEGRKGSIEWLDAAIAAAWLRPDARFEFVGRAVLDTDWRSGDEVIASRIPAALRHRFQFHGKLRPVEIRRILANARFAVVPSRWDNFPNTCLEAMSMGVPVLATRNGGSVQLLDDGLSGWLSDGPEASELHRTLMRALEAPPAQLDEMGLAASRAVRDRCDPQRVVDEQLEFKSTLAATGASRSLRVPPSLAPVAAARRVGGLPARTKGVAIGAVVVCPARRRPDRCLHALTRQSAAPVGIVLVHHDPAGVRAAPDGAVAGVEVHESVLPDRASAIKAGVAHLMARGSPPEAVVVLDEHDVLHARHLERCGGVLDHCPEVGLVSFWEGPLAAPVIRPCPARPYQWLWNDAASASVVRIAALERLDDLPALRDARYEHWYLTNCALAAGWVGVTVPEVLADRSRPEGWVDRLDATRMVEEIQAPFGDVLAQDAPALLPIARSGFAGALRDWRFRPREFSELAGHLARDWRRALRWGLQKVSRRLRSR